LSDLQPNSEYNFQIFGEGKIFVDAKNNSYFSSKTPEKPLSIVTAKPAYGKVILPNGTTQENIMVFLQIEDRKPLLTFTKSTGEWLIPLHNLVETVSGKITPIDERKKTKLMIFNDEGMTSKVELPFILLSPLGRTFNTWY
jgi:hypothetical protein